MTSHQLKEKLREGRDKMFTETRQKKLFEMVKKYLRKNKPDQVHDIDHIARVIYWTKLITKTEKADMSITLPAAILHDIAIPKYGDDLHARMGAKMCKPFLRKYGYKENEIKRISETIGMHSTDDPNPPKTIESRVLFDADKMDATGPSGIRTWIIQYTKHDVPLKEALEKMLALVARAKKRFGNSLFLTKTGRRIGGPRLAYTDRVIREMVKDLRKSEKIKY